MTRTVAASIAFFAAGLLLITLYVPWTFQPEPGYHVFCGYGWLWHPAAFARVQGFQESPDFGRISLTALAWVSAWVVAAGLASVIRGESKASAENSPLEAR